MSRRKKVMFGVLGVIIGLPILAIAIIRLPYVFNKPKVIALAQEYLEQKYTQEMQYLSITFPVIEAPYRVCFTPVNNPDLVVTVMVRDDVSLREAHSSIEYDFIPDNYYVAYFELEMRDFFKEDVKRIWGEDAAARVSVPNHALVAFTVPIGLNDQLPLQDMAALVDEYILFVDINQALGEDSNEDETRRIFDFIQTVQASGHKPNCIVFWYSVPKTAKDTSGRTNISLDNWLEITTIEQVVEQMNNQ